LNIFEYIKKNFSPDIDGFDINHYACPINYGFAPLKEDCRNKGGERNQNCEPQECWRIKKED
jgi:hypothetical protein